MFRSALFSLIILPSLALAAGDGHDHGHLAAIGAPGDAASADRSIEIVMYDNYYEPEEISVADGETVTFVVRNEGSFVHEFGIATHHMHEEHRPHMAMLVEHGVIEPDRINREAMEMDMGDGHSMKHEDPNSVLVEPGQTVELTWTFKQAKDLEFACNVPGHYESGMVGPFLFN